MVAHLRRLKKAGTVAGTFAFALLIGYVMQYGDADASRFSNTAAVDQDGRSPAQLDTSPLQLASVVAAKVPAPLQLSANRSETMRFDASSVKLTALVADAAETAHELGAGFDAASRHDDTPRCLVNLAIVPEAEAMMMVTVDSTCRPLAAFEIKHSGVLFSGKTDARGFAQMTLPALAADASVALMFEDGNMSTASAQVADAGEFHRIVFQWRGSAAEFIQTQSPSDPTGGRIDRFGTDIGENSHFAEVYTFPSSIRFAEGVNALTVRADVTDQSCGRRLLAERLHFVRGAEPERKDIRITLPSCDFAGTFLELKKVLGGQTLLQ